MAKKDSNAGKAPATDKAKADAPETGAEKSDVVTDQAAHQDPAAAKPTPESSDAAAATPSAPKEPGPRLHVTAKIDGFRRAGRPWSKDGAEVDANEFSGEQLAALLSEPNLIVKEIGDE